MVRVEAPMKDPASSAVRPLLLTAALMASVTAVVVYVVADAARLPVAAYGAVATVLVSWGAVEIRRRGEATRTLHTRYAEHVAFLERRIAEHDSQSVRLGKELMPLAIYQLRRGNSPREVMNVIVDGDERYRELPESQRVLLRAILDIVDDEEAMRESAQRSFVNIARRVQSLVHQQASELREMEEHHGRNPDVFDDLLRIDHGTALIGRLADSVAVLGKARPGRQWPRPVPLFSVLRGAMSRILEYQRVDLHSIAKVAIVGTAVEPLIHACAELLDNATRYSPPQTRVHVTAVEVQTGIAIEIEDGGVSLSEEARTRAERMLAQAQAGIDLNDLGESPRLGMAVVGRLCQMYNLQVSLRQSAYGGVRAVLVVPRDVVTTGPAPGIAHGIGATALGVGGTELPEMRPSRKAAASAAPDQTAPAGDRPADPAPAPAAVPAPRPATGPVRPAPAKAGMEDDVPVVTEWTANGLPQRRSRGRAPLGSHNIARTPAPGSANGTSAGTAGTANGTANGSGEARKPGPGVWLEAFTKAVNGEAQAPPTGSTGTDTGAGTGTSGTGTGAATDTGEAPPDRPGERGESDDVWGKGDLK
ncbi:sensor histidine kinase [Streptomyces sp. NBC_01716]|uniref:sensor histidine kinase n=1 Tax=Streptomyces sp. NBC_01716 TaxID=2975917 RepID=UPI002E30C3B2|nr:ATP-binding protein [Streptomyces sp. NBC_01716]